MGVDRGRVAAWRPCNVGSLLALVINLAVQRLFEPRFHLPSSRRRPSPHQVLSKDCLNRDSIFPPQAPATPGPSSQRSSWGATPACRPSAGLCSAAAPWAPTSGLCQVTSCPCDAGHSMAWPCPGVGLGCLSEPSLRLACGCGSPHAAPSPTRSMRPKLHLLFTSPP